VLITCWSAKGGVGTSVVAASLSIVLSDRHPAGALLVDLTGDQPHVLGLAEPHGPGVADWLVAGTEAPAPGLGRLEVAVRDGLALLPRGDGPMPEEGLALLAGELVLDPRPVVVDAGIVSHRVDDALTLVEAASISLLVVRPCYLGLRAAVHGPARPTGIVVVDEVDRSLDASDVEDVIGAPVVAVVRVEAAIARAVDAGLLCHRLPRALARPLAGAA
jgi:hypothetical protein